MAVESKVITLWDSRRVTRRFVGHESRIYSLEVPRAGPSYLLASRAVDVSVILWDVRSGKALLTLKSPGKGCDSDVMAISPNGKILAMATPDTRSLFFWDTTGVLLQKFDLNLEVF